ncbi:phage tail protein [Photobacterium frigidiphilum]|uniref:phage tail protein n=1 Tax=Photobacterium frigidiphilum TaxID=264736 RepID=UPI003D0C258A
MQHLVIGAFVFSVSGHTPLTQFTRTTKGAFSEVPLVNNATSERTGRPLETIDISAKWLRYSAQDSVDALRGLIDAPQQVSNGQGENLGRWAISNLVEGKTDFVHDGRNMVTEVSLQLLEYRGES